MKQQLLKCPHCQNSDDDLIDRVHTDITLDKYFCSVCGRIFEVRKKEDKPNE